MDRMAEVGQPDENGFLKIKLRFGRIGIMQYLGSELHKDLPQASMVNALCDESELFDPVSMATLEGMPLTVDHEWLYPEDKETLKRVTIGAVAGAVQRDGDFLSGHALITDIDAIEALQGKELVEISPAYTREIEIKAGTWNSENYDAVQRKRRYNHIALLPGGEGRSGSHVRVMDKKSNSEGGKHMPDLVKVSTPWGHIETTESGEVVIQKAMDAAKAAEDENVDIKSQLAGTTEKISRIDELDEQMATLQGERDSLAGELEGVRAELDRVSSPAAMEAMAEEMIEVKEVADKMSEDSLPKDFSDLKVADQKRAIVGVHFGMDDKSMDAKSVSDDFVLGAWKTIVKGKGKDGKTVVVAPVAKNASQDSKSTTERSSMSKLGFPKESK